MKIRQNNEGMIVILNALLFISILAAILFGITNVIVSRYSSSKSTVMSKQAYLAAQSAAGEAYYRLKNGLNMPVSLTMTIGPATSYIYITDTREGKNINVVSEAGEYERKMQVDLILGTGVAFHYGIQSGDGGFQMKNSSSVTGNVFSSGTIQGANNFIYGDVVSSGPNGLITGIHATGTAFAHEIDDSIIDKDAYYQIINDTTVGGTHYPGSPDQGPAPMPITDDLINLWESQAEKGGVATCVSGSFNINAATDLGPIKIPCDLNINGTASGYTVTIKGPVWVDGNISTSQKTTLAMWSELKDRNVAVIADDHDNPITGGLIKLSQNSSFQGSGSPGSFVFMISQNRSAENGGTINALSVGQSSDALVGYAAHGLISLAQSVKLKEITAYRIELSQSANVTYDTGLPSTLFSAGPGGSYDVLRWMEL